MGNYATVTSRYEPIVGEWQTYDINSWKHFNAFINEDGFLFGENDEGIRVNHIDIIGGTKKSDGQFQNYRVTFENGRVVLCEDLEDKSYWADKEAKEFAQYWTKLSVLGKINHKIRSNYRSLKWKFIYKFRRKWLAEQMCAPLKTPRSYIAIAKKTILIDKIPEREPTQFIE